MKVIVGLGNPGSKYKETRHNIGFEVIAELARRHFSERPRARFESEVAEVIIGGQKCLLITPLTYMNLSGSAVKAAISFYKSDPQSDLLVICDDLNLDVGRIRLRAKGSAGGQNGIKDIINKLGSQEFSRLRLGVGRPPAKWNAADYVLGKFSPADRTLIDPAIATSADAVEVWLKEDISAAMNRFNAVAKEQSPKKPKKKTQDNCFVPKTKANPTGDNSVGSNKQTPTSD